MPPYFVQHQKYTPNRYFAKEIIYFYASFLFPFIF